MPWETSRGVEFALRLDASDYRALVLATRRPLLLVLGGLAAASLATVLWVFVNQGARALQMRGTSLVFTGLVLALGYVAYVVGFVPTRMAHRSAQEPAIVVCIGDDGISVVSTRGEWTYAWSDFSRIVETDRHFFAFVSKGAALILPKRDVRHEAALARLRARL